MKVFKREKGQSMVEFAIILPILLLLLGPIVDLGRVVYAKTQLQNISGDLLHMVILENEYSYQGGSFQAMEDAVMTDVYGQKINELRNKFDNSTDQREREELWEKINSYTIDDMKNESGENYLIKDIFDKFIETEGLDRNYIDPKRYNEYVKIGPVKKGFNHKGHYPKLKKKLPGGQLINEWENKYGEDGLDEYGFDRLGYTRTKVYGPDGEEVIALDIEGRGSYLNSAEDSKRDRWIFADEVQVVDNSTYYREVTVTLPYEVENITLTGKMLFGDTTKIEETVSGIIFMGGDGRDITDPIFKEGDASNEEVPNF